jgi:hypothetical protein
MKNQKIINRAVLFFAALIFIYEAVSVTGMFTPIFNHITVKQNIILSQSLIFVPSIIFLIINRKNAGQILGRFRCNILTVIILPFLVLSIEPLITLINAISMLFVENYINDLSTSLVANNPLYVSLFFMAFLPCVIEEMAYRGIILGSFREGGRLKAIIASGLLFGIMHMNFNQMAYAIVIGIIFGIVIEATGSIVSTMIMHFMINGLSVTLSYVSSHIPALSKQLEETTVTRAELITTIEVYLPMTVVGTAFAVALIFLLAVVNDRKDNLISLFHREEPPYDQQTGRKIRIFTPLLIAIIIICLGICAYEEFVLY